MTSYPEPVRPAVICSILADYDLKDLVATAYGLQVINCQLIKPFVSATYEIITPETVFILRVYPGHQHPTSHITSELALLLALHKEDIPVVRPLPRINGSYLLPLMTPEGERQAVLFSYAEGTTLSKTEHDSQFQRFGGMVAELHDCADRLTLSLSQPPLGKEILIEKPFEHIVRQYSRYPEELHRLDRIVETIISRFDMLSVGRPVYGICHGDLNSTNVHVRPDGSLTLFDFECCGMGWRAYDVATVLNTESPEHADLFLKGYQDVRMLKDEEHRALPLFQATQKIWMLGLGASRMHEIGRFWFTERFFKQTIESIQKRMAEID